MTLFRQVTPLRDESLVGLVARAAGINVYPHSHDVLVLADLGRYRPETMPIRELSTADALAKVLGTSAQSLHPLYYRSIDHRQIDFHGTPLRAALRDVRRRRVSPRALREKTYVRAVWSIKPFSFDPRTKELLISECPVCTSTLGYSKTWRVECCEHCIGKDQDGLPIPLVDLRDFPQPVLDIDDVEALDFVTDLVDPMPQGHEPRILHDDLAGLARGHVFELVLAVATALGANSKGMFPVLGSNWRADLDEIPPEALTVAGRAMLNWPRGIHDLFSAATDKADLRPGNSGMYKAFGYLAQTANDPHLTPEARSLMGKVVADAFAQLRPDDRMLRKTTKRGPEGLEIGARHLYQSRGLDPQVTKRMGKHPAMITKRYSEEEFAPVFFNAWQAHSVTNHYKDLLAEPNLCTTLGLPPDAVRDLEAAGFFGDPSGTSRSIAIDLLDGGAYYSKVGTDHFVQSLVEGIRFQKRPVGYIPFSEAMLMFPTGRRPWLPVMLPILFQEADAVFHHNVAARPKVRNLFHSISVNAHQIQQRRASIMEDHARTRRHDIGRVSAVMSIMILGLYNHYVFMALDEAKLIDVNEQGADYQSLLDFAGEYIFLNEAAVRSCNSRQMVRPWLEARGVRPDFDFDCKGGTIYLREKVEPHLILAT